MYQKIIEVLGLLGIGGILGSVLQHLFESRRSKSERMSGLQKEIYFNLQKQAEKLLVEVGLADRRAKEINIFIESNTFGQPPHEVTIIDRVERVSSASVYFSQNIIQKYNAIMDSFNTISIIYHRNSNRDDLLKSDGESINRAFGQLESDIKEFRKALMHELDLTKEKII